jgi:hypothetical protein
MPRAYCDTCRRTPAELISRPLLDIDPKTSEPVHPEWPVILDAWGNSLNRWEDGTVGVPQEIQDAAVDDEQPLCSVCKGEVRWVPFD